MLFHAGVPGFAGGFVGVDVFFVLSGFFITGHARRASWRDNGDVRLTEFYGRRALRLLPALLVVLLATLAGVIVALTRRSTAPRSPAARAPVALYAGNVEFARGAVDYFSAGENPLLHTWSLAVEEQFYLVWPLLFLVVAAAYDRKLGEDAVDADAVAGKRLLIPVVVAACASLVASLWLTRATQPWAFFGMPTRIWEFALGGALALVIARPALEPSLERAAAGAGSRR